MHTRKLKIYLYASLVVSGLYFLILATRTIIAYGIVGDVVSYHFFYNLLTVDIFFISGFHVLDRFMVWYIPLALLILIVVGIVLLIKTRPRPPALRAVTAVNIAVFLIMLILALYRIGLSEPQEPPGKIPQGALQTKDE